MSINKTLLIVAVSGVGLLSACNKALTAATTTVVAASPASTHSLQPLPEDLRRLATFMAGNYSSAAQAKADKEYLSIELHIAPILIPLRRQQQYYFYVEQAMTNSPAEPYRQRVYRLTRTRDGHFGSTTFTLNAPKRFVGAWRNPAQHPTLLALRPDSLKNRDGCDVFLSKTGDLRFQGTTDGRHCASTISGASYATSEVVLTPRTLLTWDRGFDIFGKQKWGATKGAYVFVKEE